MEMQRKIIEEIVKIGDFSLIGNNSRDLSSFCETKYVMKIFKAIRNIERMMYSIKFSKQILATSPF
jgi:hypothetical protein